MDFYWCDSDRLHILASSSVNLKHYNMSFDIEGRWRVSLGLALAGGPFFFWFWSCFWFCRVLKKDCEDRTPLSTPSSNCGGGGRMRSYQNITHGVHKHWMNKTSCRNKSLYSIGMTLHVLNQLESSAGVRVN